MYPVHQLREIVHCFCIRLIVHACNTYNSTLTRQKYGGSACSNGWSTRFFMRTNHKDMVADTPAFSPALLSSRLPSCKQTMAGIFSQTSRGEIGTWDLPLSKLVGTLTIPPHWTSSQGASQLLKGLGCVLSCLSYYVISTHKRTCMDHWNMPNHHAST